MKRPERVKTAIAAVVLAMLMGGCATDGTGGAGGFYGGYYDDYWYGPGYGVVVDNPGEIGSGPRPEHPIALPPGSQPRPEHPIATPPRAEPKANVSASQSAASARPSVSTRSGSFGGGGFGGGRGGGGGRR